MKRNWILVVALSAMGSLLADDAFDTAYVVQATPQPATTIEATVAPVPPQYDNQIGLSPTRLFYERTKSDEMYFGIDAWAGAIISHTHNRGEYGSILEAEARVGYNLLNGLDHLTPFAGGGYLYINIGHFNHAKIAYATIGFKYSHEFNTVFGWGLNVKGLAGQQLSHHDAKKFAWGIDVSMPLIFRFGRLRHWDVTAEPAYLYVESHHKHQSVVLARSSIGYRF